MSAAVASALRRVVMIAPDLERTRSFYARALDAVTVRRGPLAPGWPALLDVAAGVELVMRIGAQEVSFVTPDPPGAPYPPGSTASDLWFQHIAIVVADMDRAYAQVLAAGATPISRDGPARLPASSGGVRAFKFRDPDGHPLELLWFPSGGGPARWREPGDDRLIRGVDHSAIAVADTGRSAAFYARTLDLRRTGASVNRGPAQVALDDVADDLVDVLALSPLAPTPHVELLGYRAGRRRPMPIEAGPADVAATRLVFTVETLGPLVDGAPVVSVGSGRRALALRDPDGHRLVILTEDGAA